VTLLAKRLVKPDHDTGPEWVTTLGPAVAEFNAGIGFPPDPQQEHALNKICAIRPDGLSACFEYGCVVCRQNLKTGLFKQLGIGWLFVYEVPWFVWSAHEMSTTLESMREIHTLIADSYLSKLLPATRNAGLYEDNNKTRIELKNGQRILFKARTQSGGRGLAAPKVILDEAFALRPTHVGSLLPALAAQADPQVVYGSSAGKPDDVILLDIRDRGRSGSSPRLGYDEWLAEREACADPDCRHPKDAVPRGIDCALDRIHLREEANPALATGRITMETLDGLRQALPPEEFAREGLGWWDDEDKTAGKPVINLRTWKGEHLSRPETPASKRAAVVLDVEPDRSQSSIGVAGEAAEGRVLLMTKVFTDTSQVVPALVKLKGNVDVLEVALHPSTQATILIPALKAAGIEFVPLVHKDIGGGCATVQVGVVEQRIVHLGQSELDDAVAVARTRMVNQVEIWDRSNPNLPISALASVATAMHRWDLLEAQPKEPPPPPQRAGRTRARRPSKDVAHAGF
jgi:hypothetical protein